MNRLVLIDGNAILHRAYHALPPLTDPQGNMVNAVYGFTSIIIKLFHDLRPTHMAVAFDRAAPTFRKKMFVEYQAHRPKLDDELISQIGTVHDVVSAFHIPIYEQDGFEADDVIGTLCQSVKSRKSKVGSNTIDEVIIVTGDRDILQLVDDGKIMVYMPVKGLSEAKLYESKEVIERLGVKPEQIPDYKALAGDSSDNYPGVPGVGPKTAADLLEKYTTVEGIYRSLEEGKGSELPEKLRQKLIDGKESAEMSHDLATIRTNVPIEIDEKKLMLGTLDTPEIRDILGKLNFHSLIKRIENNGKPEEKKRKEDRKKNEEKTSDEQLTLV
jgi:DNA polymerase I